MSNKLVVSEAHGTVHTYNSERGYGFVHTLDVPDQISLGVDAFFHISDVPENSVQEGWRFKFELRKSRKGFRATAIKIISKDKAQSETKKLRKGTEIQDPPPDDEMYNPHAAKQAMEKGQKTETEGDDDPGDSPFDDEIRGSKNDLIK